MTMPHVLRDSLRGLGRTPLITLTSVITLAGAIAALSTRYAMLDA